MISGLMHKFSLPKAPAGRKRASQTQRTARALRRHISLVVAATIMLMILAADAAGVFTRLKDDAVALAGRTAVEAGLVVSGVHMGGVVRSDEVAVREALAIVAGDPLLEIDMTAARARIEALPWVRSATISRRLPGDLLVDIAEREPYALWQLDGHLWLIDEAGVKITDKDLYGWRALPLVVGAGAADGAPALLALLDREPALLRRVKAAVRVSERRWDIRFENGVNLLLPAEIPVGQAKVSGAYGPLAAWIRFAALERRHAILEREIVSLDMRQSDRLVVRVTPEGQEALADRDQRT